MLKKKRSLSFAVTKLMYVYLRFDYKVIHFMKINLRMLFVPDEK